MIISVGTTGFVASINTEKADDLKSMELKIDEKHTIQLYPESTLTKEVVNKKFKEAIEYIRNDLKDFEIEIHIDNEEFQKTVKRCFLIDIEDEEQQKNFGICEVYGWIRE